MRKCFILFFAAMLLCGCQAAETMETVADEWYVPVIASPREIRLDLPGEASICAMENDSGRLYLNDGYEIAVQTFSAGDLNATVQSLTGFAKEELTIMQTRENDLRRYEFVWSSAGESGDRTGHGVILDDGNYHYCLSVLRNADLPDNCQVVWSQMFRSFDLT